MKLVVTNDARMNNAQTQPRQELTPQGAQPKTTGLSSHEIPHKQILTL